MKWKKMIAIGLIAGVVLSIAGCGNKSADPSNTDDVFTQTETDEYEDETVYNSLGFAPTDEILNADLEDLKIQIGNTVYYPGAPIKDLFNEDWSISLLEESISPTTLIHPGEKIMLYISPPGEYETLLAIENPTDEELNLEDCVVASDFLAPKILDSSHASYESKSGFSMSDEEYRNGQEAYVWLPGGISVESSIADVEEAYGEAYVTKHASSSDPTNRLEYRIASDEGKAIWYDFSSQSEQGTYIDSVTIGTN